MTKTAILGFGNPARSDDGIGCYVIEQLREQLKDVGDLTILDMGTSAFEVLFQLQGHERILLVDAVVQTNEPDGTLYKVPAAEDPMVFLHSLKWDQALSYARKIMQDDYPEDITVYLISVTNTKLEIGLSDDVKTAGDRLVNIVLKDLNIGVSPSTENA